MLLHGWALDLNYWDITTDLLVRDFSVLRFDRRGFGLTQAAHEPAHGVGDLAAVLDAAQVERAVLLGMSQGARLAIRFAGAHPHRVRALILDGAPAFEGEPELPVGKYRHLLTTAGEAALHGALLAHPLMQLQTREEAAMRLLHASVGRYRGADLSQPAAVLPPPPLGAVDTPVLILNGGRDTVERRSAGRTLQQTLPGARRFELPGAGHLAALDDPGAYVKAVRSFLAALPP